MNAIKKIGPKLDDVHVAHQILEGLSKIKGFLFGHVDETEMRCVYFVKAIRSNDRPLSKLCEYVQVSHYPWFSKC